MTTELERMGTENITILVDDHNTEDKSFLSQPKFDTSLSGSSLLISLPSGRYINLINSLIKIDTLKFINIALLGTALSSKIGGNGMERKTIKADDCNISQSRSITSLSSSSHSSLQISSPSGRYSILI